MQPDEMAERAALMEFDGGLPRVWAESMARLCTAPRPGAYLPEVWATLVEDGAKLIDRHLTRIVGNGWTPDDVRGLLPLIQGREVVAVHIADVVVRGGNGAKETIYRRPSLGGAARWDAGRRRA